MTLTFTNTVQGRNRICKVSRSMSGRFITVCTWDGSGSEIKSDVGTTEAAALDVMNHLELHERYLPQLETMLAAFNQINNFV